MTADCRSQQSTFRIGYTAYTSFGVCRKMYRNWNCISSHSLSAWYCRPILSWRYFVR